MRQVSRLGNVCASWFRVMGKCVAHGSAFGQVCASWFRVWGWNGYVPHDSGLWVRVCPIFQGYGTECAPWFRVMGQSVPIVCRIGEKGGGATHLQDGGHGYFHIAR